MTDVYAEFGVNGAVMSSNNITEHEQNMLALPTSVRDGDDTIELNTPEESTEGTEEEQLEEATEEGGEEEGEQAEESEDGEQESAETEGEFTPLADPDAELIAASKALDENADGFTQMKEQAIKNGLSAELAAKIEAEYEADNALSEESLKALEAAGFNRGFVKSYIQGQEAMATSYVNKVVEYAGGQAKFNSIVAHLSANSPDSVALLNEAIGRQDLAAVKAVINLGMASQVKKFGKQPARSVTKNAPASPQKPAANKVAGFANQSEMVKAMSDSKYQNDPAYRQTVEARVAASSW